MATGCLKIVKIDLFALNNWRFSFSYNEKMELCLYILKQSLLIKSPKPIQGPTVESIKIRDHSWMTSCKFEHFFFTPLCFTLMPYIKFSGFTELVNPLLYLYEWFYLLMCLLIKILILGRMLKSPPLTSSNLHFSVLKCHWQT